MKVIKFFIAVILGIVAFWLCLVSCGVFLLI